MSGVAYFAMWSTESIVFSASSESGLIYSSSKGVQAGARCVVSGDNSAKTDITGVLTPPLVGAGLSLPLLLQPPLLLPVALGVAVLPTEEEVVEKVDDVFLLGVADPSGPVPCLLETTFK